MRLALVGGHVIVCGRKPVAPVGYFIRNATFAAQWTTTPPARRGRTSTRACNADLEKLAQRNAAFVIWIDGASDDPEGWKVIKDLAHEIAIDTAGALVALRDRAVLDLPPITEVDAAQQATLDAAVAVDRAIVAARGGDGLPLERLVDEPSSVLAAALADRAQQTVAHRAMAWAEANPPSRANVAPICVAACDGDPEAIAQVHSWALRWPADPPSPLSRAEMGERLAFVGPFCSAVRAARKLHPEIWTLANLVMGSKLAESGGTLAALRAKLPEESA